MIDKGKRFPGKKYGKGDTRKDGCNKFAYLERRKKGNMMLPRGTLLLIYVCLLFRNQAR